MISVVMPSYNHVWYLGKSLQSIIDQAGVQTEIIVVDDGSTDGSLDIIKQFEHRLSYWATGPNRGLGPVLAKGMKRTSGEILGWVNSDDYLEPGALSVVETYFHDHPRVDVIYGDMKWVNRAGEVVKNQREVAFDLGSLLWDYNYIPQPSTFWRRGVWDRSGGIDESLRCAMDYDLWLKFLSCGARFKHIPTVLSTVRVYPEQLRQRIRTTCDKELRLARERFLKRKPSETEIVVKKAYYKTKRVAKRCAIGAYWATESGC